MKYRYRPSASQKAAFIKMLKDREELNFIKSGSAIRVGCKVKWHHKSDGNIYEGIVKKSTYQSDGQHKFTISIKNGKHKMVMGRNLYDSLLAHELGEISMMESKW